MLSSFPGVAKVQPQTDMTARGSWAVEANLCPGCGMGIIIREYLAHKELEEKDRRKAFPDFAGWRALRNVMHHFFLARAVKTDKDLTEEMLSGLIESLQTHAVGLWVFGHILIAVA